MKFTVPVLRISYQFADIDVEADTQEAADSKALDEAGNHLYSEKNVEYALADSDSEESRLRKALIRLRDGCERAAASPTKGPFKATADGCLEVFTQMVEDINKTLQPKE